MKKIFLTIATAGLLVTNAFAADGGKKTENTVSVSYTVLNEFNSTFSDAKDVVWTITPNCQKAIFTLDGVTRTAFYNLQGEYLGNTQNVEYKEIADKAKKEIAGKYKDYAVKEVIKLNTLDAEVNFEKTVYFVDLKSQSDEVLLRVTPDANVFFFQQVK